MPVKLGVNGTRYAGGFQWVGDHVGRVGQKFVEHCARNCCVLGSTPQLQERQMKCAGIKLLRLVEKMLLLVSSGVTSGGVVLNQTSLAREPALSSASRCRATRGRKITTRSVSQRWSDALSGEQRSRYAGTSSLTTSVRTYHGHVLAVERGTDDTRSHRMFLEHLPWP